MTELDTVIVSMVSKLDAINQKVQLASGRSNLKIPECCYKMWGNRAELLSYLQKTLAICELRNAALKELKELGDVRSDEMWKEYVRQKGLSQDSPYVIQRCFALSKYLMAVWALYDRLANVCGRLIGPVSIGNNPNQKRNPQLYSSFIEKKQERQDNQEGLGGKKEESNVRKQDRPDGFSLSGILPDRWKWPVIVSYKLRNLVVHEGAAMEGGRIFAGEGFQDAFQIHQELKNLLVKECFTQTTELPTNEQFPSGLRYETDFPWYDDSLISILEKYNGEIDELYSCTLEWCVTAFCSQVEIFMRPDIKNLLLATSLKIRQMGNPCSGVATNEGEKVT